MVFSLCFSLNSISQKNFDKVIERYNEHSVEYITTKQLIQLQKNKENYTLLDTRSIEEYQVSHIKNAIHVGYANFDLKQAEKNFNKTDTLVVYCSVGVRSEQIGAQLQKAGYTKVYNLYGGIFLWKNLGNPIFNLSVKETDSIHAYDKKWGKLIEKGIKVYE